MRKWRCVGYNKNEKLFTIGKIYSGDENGMKCDDGFCFNHSEDIDEIMEFFK